MEETYTTTVISSKDVDFYSIGNHRFSLDPMQVSKITPDVSKYIGDNIRIIEEIQKDGSFIFYIKTKQKSILGFNYWTFLKHNEQSRCGASGDSRIVEVSTTFFNMKCAVLEAIHIAEKEIIRNRKIKTIHHQVYL